MTGGSHLIDAASKGGILHDGGHSVVAAWGGHVLHTAFQPIFRFSNDGGLVQIGAEALLRPFLGAAPVPPLRFFERVEQGDLASLELVTGRLHIANAARHLAPGQWLFLNFDPSILMTASLWRSTITTMQVALRDAGIAPDCVVCEMTEQKSGSDRALVNFVRALRAEGCKVAVDDYGSHDSDRSRIDMLKPDVVKFDAGWVTRLMNSGAGFTLLTEMVETFKNQRILTVFEGIETDLQLRLAEQAGATMVQGYVLAKPVIV